DRPHIPRLLLPGLRRRVSGQAGAGIADRLADGEPPLSRPQLRGLAPDPRRRTLRFRPIGSGRVRRRHQPPDVYRRRPRLRLRPADGRHVLRPDRGPAGAASLATTPPCPRLLSFADLSP